MSEFKCCMQEAGGEGGGAWERGYLKYPLCTKKCRRAKVTFAATYIHTASWLFNCLMSIDGPTGHV